MSLQSTKDIKSTRADKYFGFQKAVILQAVKEVESGLDRKEACAKYGMNYGTLSEWLRRYGSEVYHSSKKSRFTVQQKRTLVRAVKEGRMTKQEACLSYKIAKRLLNVWIREFSAESTELVAINEPIMAKNCTDPLENELQEAKLKIKALETLIDIAEEQYKISIRKKPGAKQ